MGELSILESSARLECQKVQQKIASLLSAQDMLQMHLNASRGREFEYEVRLGIEQEKMNGRGKGIGEEVNRIAGSSSSGAGSVLGFGSSLGIGSGFDSRNILNTSSSSREIEFLGEKDDGSRNRPVRDNNNINGHPLVTSEIDSTLVTNSFQNKDPGPGSGMGMEKEDGELKGNEHSSEGAPSNKMEIITSTLHNSHPEPEPNSILCLLTLKQVQERAKETQIELDEARGSLNDLILEIEAVSVEEGRSREQSARILRQMADR